MTYVYLTLFRLGFFGRPWTGVGGGERQTTPPLRFLKTIKDIDMKLTPLIKRREIKLLLLSYLSYDVTKAPSWIFGLCQNTVKTYFFASNLLNNFIR